jgi:hypothetical protein
VQHRGAEHGRQVVQGHLVLALEMVWSDMQAVTGDHYLEGGDPDQMLDQEDDAGLARVLWQLAEQVKVGARPLVLGSQLGRVGAALHYLLCYCVGIKQLGVGLAGEDALREVPEKSRVKQVWWL